MKGAHPQVEQWCEHHYPSFVVLRTDSDTLSQVNQGVSSDSRLRIIERQEGLVKRRNVANGMPAEPAAAAVANLQDQEKLPWELIAFMVAAFVGICALSGGIVLLVLKFVVDD